MVNGETGHFGDVLPSHSLAVVEKKLNTGPRLHDTTGCQTGWTPGWTTGCIV